MQATTRGARRFGALLVGLTALVVPNATLATNLAGKWRFRYSATDVQYVDVTDAAGAVSAVIQPAPLPSPIAIDGAFSEVTGILTMDDPACTPTLCLGVSARVLPDGNDFVGYVAYVTLPLPSYVPLTAHRCECFDGNAVDGDGCDAECRIEPCFTCTGIPSTCFPSGDGSACEDGSPCTSGETCMAGSCGGGSPVLAPCADLNGSWVFTYAVPSLSLSSIENVTVRHRGTTFRVTGANGVSLGSITQASGAVVMPFPITAVLCPGFTDFTGSASPEGDALSLAGTTYASTPMRCVGFAATIAGRRQGCGDGLFEPGEACDDGNTTSGDGCDATCVPEPCFSCSGIAPTVCEPAFAATCSTATQPRRSIVSLQNVAAATHDAFVHRLRTGSTLAPSALGDPMTASEYEVCLFDVSQPSPQVLFSARVAPGGTCDGHACWRAKPNGFKYRSKTGNASGIQLLDVRGGIDGTSRVTVRGRGPNLSGRAGGLPTPPLATPVTLVVRRLDGPACFVTNFTTALDNSATSGRFRARGGP